MLARRREYLYLGGMLSSGFSMLTWLKNSEFASSSVEFQLCFGLVIFVGYIVFNSQNIIEKAHCGDMDYVNHSLIFFINFVGVFIHVLIIMLKNSLGKEEKRGKRRNQA
ncbi:hypothetical protein AALP_AA6G106400 [Arabis alpina]|uniref:Uncharacterized protein n=1 Tax=Arabis alpina TaxID=50452 RepID=A0A087GNE2_ARAAL|nr:hypothetical protein AALP_AA6G106400 [Arabis alpina]